MRALTLGSRGGAGSLSGLLDRLAACVAAALLAASALGVEMAALPDPERAAARAASAAHPLIEVRGGETQIGAYFGAPYTYPSTLRIEHPGRHDFIVDPVHWYAEPFRSPLYYGVRVSRWASGGAFGSMLDFTHSKTIADRNRDAKFEGTKAGSPISTTAKIAEQFDKLEFSHGHNMLTLNGLMRLPALSPTMRPYAGLGAGASLPHTEVQLRGENTRTYEYNYAGLVGQALVGVEFRLSKVSLFLEYKFTLADYEAPLSNMDGSWLFLDLWRQIKRWIDSEPPPGGYASTRLTSHQAIGGFAVRIGPAAAIP